MNIINYLNSKNITLKELSKECNISYSTLRKSIKNPESFEVFNFQKIAKYLELSMEELYSLFLRRESPILTALTEQKQINLSGNLYHYTQIQMAYNSNKIEGSKLTKEEIRLLYDTNTLLGSEATSMDDLVETANHFYLFNVMLSEANKPLAEEMIKKYHEILLSGTSSSRKEWFKVGEYKALANKVNGLITTKPKDVPHEMKSLLLWYSALEKKRLKDLVEFHYRFEKIHPFQDGNGRIGRMILFRECLNNDIMPFIIPYEYKEDYYRGLAEFREIPGYLKGVFLSLQNNYEAVCKRFLNTLGFQ